MGLVITKAVGESFSVEGPCVVKIEKTGNNRVRVRIEAGPKTKINRNADSWDMASNPDLDAAIVRPDNASHLGQ